MGLWAATDLLICRSLNKGQTFYSTHAADRWGTLSFRELPGILRLLSELNFRLIIALALHCLLASQWNSPLSDINTLEIFITRDCKNEIWTTRRYSDGQPFEDFLSLDIFSWSQSELWAEIKFSWSNLLQIVSINWLSSLLTVYILFTECWECIAHSHVFFWCFIRALITIL